ncbi:MAG: hypothetical protein QXO84_00810 [Candidatus Aenigmatarchaeota archaeon]
MTLKCLNCNSETIEMRECDRCGKIGCHKCLRKKKNEWICLDCEKNQSENSSIFA